MSPWRTRLAVGGISLAVIVLELALMRALSLRFWHHFAQMVIGVALLGFGVSGTALTLLGRRVRGNPARWLWAAALAFALNVPASLRAARAVELDVQLLAWDLALLGRVALLELILLVPFLFGATAVGAALMGRPERIGGHYAASLLGSGAGAVLAVAAMHWLSVGALLVGVSVLGLAAAGAVTSWRRWRPAVTTVVVAVATGLLLWRFYYRPDLSPYKMLPLVRAMPGSDAIHHDEGPLGHLDVVAGPAIHHAPGLSLHYSGDVPPHALLIVDGDQTSAVYDAPDREDQAFLDFTTAAVAYALRERPSVCIVGAGGGADIALATYHRSPRVVGLEMNARVIDAMRGPLRERGGRIYDAPGVEIVAREARGYLIAGDERFDVIQLPAIEAFGASGAGLYATQESYLLTVESFAAMLDRLTEGGLLCVTRWARTPPRDALRILDTAAEALRRRGTDPAAHLAMIRSWATATTVVSLRPLTDADTGAIRTFCRERSFDLCFLPGVTEKEANRFHILDRPYFFEGAVALLSPQRREYLDAYLYDVAATTDDKPYFFHFLRWRSWKALQQQLGRRSRAFLELGFLMLLGALVQAAVLAAILVLLPLAPRAGGLRRTGGKAPAVGYFLLLGAGFMLLEMGFLQKLILYLAHPIYSAATAIAAFLVFAGLGSYVCTRWPGGLRRVNVLAGVAVAVLAGVYAWGLDGWLARTQASSLSVRFLLAAVTIAPLAFAMGHMFPLGLRRLAGRSPQLVPWAWAVNGFASVVATLAAPVIAMQIGFTLLIVAAIASYVLATLLAARLPAGA